MEEKLRRDLLLQEIDGYAELLSQRNVSVNSSIDLPDGLSIKDLLQILEHYKTLARTPTR